MWSKYCVSFSVLICPLLFCVPVFTQFPLTALLVLPKSNSGTETHTLFLSPPSWQAGSTNEAVTCEGLSITVKEGRGCHGEAEIGELGDMAVDEVE